MLKLRENAELNVGGFGLGSLRDLPVLESTTSHDDSASLGKRGDPSFSSKHSKQPRHPEQKKDNDSLLVRLLLIICNYF